MSLGQKVKKILGAAIIFGVIFGATVGPVYAKKDADTGAGTCPKGSVREGDAIGSDDIKSVADCNVQKTEKEEEGLEGVAVNLINWVISILGVIAVFVIVLGGIQYTMSTGEAAKIKQARDTILYGVIGLVVAVTAFAIVNFVLGNF